MRINAISADDMVEAHIRGRVVLDRVTEIRDGVVYFHPLCPATGWRHARAREIVAHWRKAGRRGGGAEDRDESSASLREQLTLPTAPD